MRVQEELHEILEECFKDSSKELVDYKGFLHIVENVCSDIYFFILVFLMENWPFSKSALNEYGKQKSPAGGNNNKLKLGSNINSPSVGSKLVASPNLSSKFGPSLTLSKSPMNKGKSLDVSYGDGMDSGSKNFPRPIPRPKYGQKST